MTAPTLETLGWTSAWAEAFAPHRDAGLVPARVTLEHNHICDLLAHQNDKWTDDQMRDVLNDVDILQVMEVLKKGGGTQ